jgi:hypothetical protein
MTKGKSGEKGGDSSSQLIDARIAELGDWRGVPSSLDGNTMRAIDIHEDDTINEKALKTLIRAAVALNTS